jgi:hypothetical protein
VHRGTSWGAQARGLRVASIPTVANAINPSYALKNRSYLEDLDLIVRQETELIAVRRQAVVIADQSKRLTDYVSLLCSQCGASATARPAIRSNEPIVVRSGRVDAPLGRRSGPRSAGRPPSARLSPENDARRAERVPAMLQVRPRFSLRPARSPLADAKPKGPQQARGERVHPPIHLTWHHPPLGP